MATIAKKLKKSVRAVTAAKKQKAKKYVYFFGAGKADGKAEMKNLLGGKGANLAEMVNIFLSRPVSRLLLKYAHFITGITESILPS